MTLLLLLAGCDRPEPWTEEQALAPVLVRLDADGDGRVTDPEYARVAWQAPPFVRADQDGDGALSTAELAALLDGQDPHVFDGTRARGAPDPELGPGMSGAMNAGQRHAWEVLHALAEEATAAGATVPSDAEIDAAARDGLDGPAGRALRVRMHAAWTEAGLPFPAGLAVPP